jgi:alkylation response protein AidB-like acyl-CoA dehydrogenase
MGMRRMPHRQLGTRRCGGAGAKAHRAGQLIRELVRAHEENIALVRTLLLTHVRADGHHPEVDELVSGIAAEPVDRRANEPGALAKSARVAECSAAEKWADHVMQLHGLLAMIDELYCDPRLAPGREVPTAVASRRPVPLRLRGDCFGRPG